MPTINVKVCVVNGVPVDKVFSNGKQVYGRNLITGSSNELKTGTASGWGSKGYNGLGGTYRAGKYYASVYIENTTPDAMRIVVRINGLGYNINGNDIPAGQSGISILEFDMLEGQSLATLWVAFASPHTESYTYKHKEMMVKQIPTTPWSPAPEDVM